LRGDSARLIGCWNADYANPDSREPSVSDETLAVTLADAPNVKVSELLEKTRQRPQSSGIDSDAQKSATQMGRLGR
jgi:hypothetical protein